MEYEYKGEKHIIDTPYLTIYPSDLIRKDVDVYLYDGMCYVDNYKINIEERIIEKKKNNKKFLFTFLWFIIIALLFVFIIYLSIIGVIKEERAIRLAFKLMIFYCLVGVYISFKDV